MTTLELAQRIDKLAYDFDTYEYNDTIEDREENAIQIEKSILNKDIQHLFVICNDVLDSEDTNLYQEATEILELLINITRF